MKYYVGKHTGSINDFETGKYRTSCNLIRDNYDSFNFEVKIVKIFSNPRDATIFEAKYHQRLNVKNHPLFFNRNNQTLSGKFDRTGMVTVFDNKLNINRTISIKEFRNDKTRFTSVAKNIVLCKTTEGSILQVSKHEFDTRDDLVGINKNIVYVKDLTGNSVKITKEEYHKNKDLYIISTKNKVVAFDILLNKNTSISKEEFYNNRDRYIGIKSKTGNKYIECRFCKRNIQSSNISNHEKSCENAVVFITRNDNKNSFKIYKRDFYNNEEIKNNFYIIERGRNSFGFFNYKKINLRSLGKILKNVEEFNENWLD